MLHHGFEGHELQDRPNRILPVRYAVSEDAHCFFQLLRIRVFEARVSDLWPVKDATKGLLRNGNTSPERGHLQVGRGIDKLVEAGLSDGNGARGTSV